MSTESKLKQPELAKHDASVLDLAFSMDCTGSMGSYIAAATESIRTICEEIVALEKSDIKLALVEYRDHPPQDKTFVTKKHDFTDSIKDMKKWLEGCKASGGGDEPEAVADSLYDALNLKWREKSTKILVLVSDAPPHGLISSGDSFPNGCPDGHDPIEIVNKMAEKGITLYVVGCEPSLLRYKNFFSSLAFSTGGQYVPLRNAKLLSKVIVGGAREEISLEKLMADVEKEVDELQQQGIVDEAVLSKEVQKRFQSRGIATQQLKMNNLNLESASDVARNYSKMKKMSEVKAAYSSEAPPVSGSGGIRGMEMYGMHAPPSAMMSRAMAMGGGETYGASKEEADSYDVECDTINIEQSERLVTKALARKSKK